VSDVLPARGVEVSPFFICTGRRLAGVKQGVIMFRRHAILPGLLETLSGQFGLSDEALEMIFWFTDSKNAIDMMLAHDA